MKYRALLMGNNRAIIDDMFVHLNEYFELQSVSSRFDDIASHLKYFQPHAVIYCMHNETRDTMSQLITIKRDKVKRQTLFAIVATQDDCDEFRKMSANTADLELVKPITALQIADRITKYLDTNLHVQENDLEDVLQEMRSESSKQVEAQKPGSILNDLNSLLTPNAQANMRKHILVVDDDFRMLKLIKRYLEDSYDIATAINGKVALKFLENKMTNLILLDYEMPEENGPAVLEKLRQNPITNEIPVIFLTGINDRKKIQQVLALKPQGYLLKPIDHTKLIEAIEKTIG
ncbi:MAG: response regulator [Eubacterium sp.]|nr:response regulator [Eubacterium sp.]